MGENVLHTLYIYIYNWCDLCPVCLACVCVVALHVASVLCIPMYMYNTPLTCT